MLQVEGDQVGTLINHLPLPVIATLVALEVGVSHTLLRNLAIIGQRVKELLTEIFIHHHEGFKSTGLQRSLAGKEVLVVGINRETQSCVLRPSIRSGIA